MNHWTLSSAHPFLGAFRDDLTDARRRTRRIVSLPSRIAVNFRDVGGMGTEDIIGA